MRGGVEGDMRGSGIENLKKGELKIWTKAWWEEGKKLLKNLEVGNLKKIKFSGNLVGNLPLKVIQ